MRRALQSPSMARTATELPSPGHCPNCGYDQRGLTPGSKCPECGQVFWGGLAVSRINNWADRTLLHLWSITVLMLVGGGSIGVSLSAFGLNHPGGFMLGMAGGLYLVAALLWYATTLVLYLHQRRRPAFTNMTEQRRRALDKWITVDGVLAIAVIPMIGAML